MILRKIKTFVCHPVAAIRNRAEEARRAKVAEWLKPENYKDLSDEDAIKAKYYSVFGIFPDLRHPKTFNEKLQWLKLYDRRPEYSKMVDKYEVKKYIAETVGEEYVVPTLGVWESADDIDFDALPDQFVIKCTHDSASVIICKNKSEFDAESARARLSECLKKTQFGYGREWPYKNVKPRIIAEQYLVDESGEELKDYKVNCFGGRAEYLDLHFGRFSEHKKNHYDFEWNPLYFSAGSPTDYSVKFERPSRLDDMKRVSETLSRDIPFLRVDFYSIYDRIYVGELTFFPGSGFNAFDPPEIDLEMGEKLTLPKKIKTN